MEGAGKLNTEVKTWADSTNKKLQQEFDVLNIQHVTRSPSPHPSRDVLKAFLRKRQSLVDRVSFKFPRHMVFVHKGVGKGVPIALAGSNATTRKPKPWFDNVMDKQVDDLADRVAEHSADIVVDNFKIK